MIAGEGIAGRLLAVDVVAEQLRRPVPGGIGTYALGLLSGLHDLVANGGPAPSVGRLRVVAAPFALRGDDPLASYGAEQVRAGLPWSRVVAQLAVARDSEFLAALPDAIVTRLWDAGIGRQGAGADVVHSVSMAFPPTGRVPLTAMVHDVAWRQAPQAFPRHGVEWHEAALRRISRSAAAVVVPSQAAAKALCAAAAELDPSRIEVIPHGCDHLQAPDRQAARRVLARLGVGAKGGYILSVSTLEPRKNLRRLVEAYGRARHNLPEPWPLVVVGPSGWGDGPPAGEGVVLAGRMSGAVLSGLYSEASVVAYVPLAEGFGLPAMEAMAAGAPLIASTGVPSVLELAPWAARVVEPWSVASIAEAIGELASDEAARQSLVAAGTSAVASRTWVQSASRHVALWARIVEGEPTQVADQAGP
jgi:glycosyltransferase involved in cell wall biosynthesis